MPGRFIKSEWTAPNGSCFEMQHRYEDRALILDVIRTHRPGVFVELGTAKGGFAAMIADAMVDWNGTVYTFDKHLDPAVERALFEAYPNHNLWTNRVDVLNPSPKEEELILLGVTHRWVESRLRGGECQIVADWKVAFYCDNGNKMKEIERYAPKLRSGDLLGTHDYWTEVDPKWVEPFLADLGYVQHRHAEFEALADPVNYPASLTRFWTRS